MCNTPNGKLEIHFGSSDMPLTFTVPLALVGSAPLIRRNGKPNIPVHISELAAAADEVHLLRELFTIAVDRRDELIRRASQAGLSQPDIAEIARVSQPRVNSIIHRLFKARRHRPPFVVELEDNTSHDKRTRGRGL